MRPFLTLILLASILRPSPVWADTILDRVLARIEAGPLLIFDGLHVNYAGNGEAAEEQVITTVDGSITLITHSEPAPTAEATAGSVTVTEPADPDAAPVYTVEATTASTGATNVGMIEVDHRRAILVEQPVDPSAPAPTVQGYGVVALNAASNGSDVLGSISMVSSGATINEGKLSTSAIGATNTGSINVVLSTSVVTPAGRP